MSTRRLSVERPAVRPRTGPGARLAFAGAVSVVAALAVGELVAGILPDAPSPLLAVAQLIVDYQPAGAKDFVVGLFGASRPSAAPTPSPTSTMKSWNTSLSAVPNRSTTSCFTPGGW